MSHRPTSLKIFQQNCAFALKLFGESEGGALAGQQRMDSYAEREDEVEGGQARDEGIAFHSILHAASEATVKNEPVTPAMKATALVLARKMNPERAYAGYELAEQFLLFNEIDPRMKYEHGLAFDKKWQPVAWDAPERHMRMVCDVYGVYEDHDPELNMDARIAVISDYKTGWGVKEDDLDGVQALCHSSALLKLHGSGADADVLLLRIVAVRYHRVYEKRWFVDSEESMADLNARFNKLQFLIQAADTTDYAPRVGPGCTLCSYSDKCPSFQQRLSHAKNAIVADAYTDPVSALRDMVVLNKKVAEIKDILETALKAGPITVDSKQYGYFPARERELIDATELVQFWYDKAGPNATVEDAIRTARGLVKHMKPGVTAAENVFKALAHAAGYRTQKEAVSELGKKFFSEKEKAKLAWKDKTE